MKLFNDNNMYNKNLSSGDLILQVLKPVFIYFVVSVLVTIVFYTIAGITGELNIKSTDAMNIFNQNYAFIITILGQIVSLIILYFIYKKDKKTYPKVEKKCNNKLLIYGGLLVLVFGIASGYLMELLKYLFPKFGSGYEEVEIMISSTNIFIVFISTCLLAPIVEEIMCRGLILNNLLSKKSILFSILISSIIFGVIHLNLLQGLNAFILGISLSIVYIKTRNLYACMLGHFLNNIISIIPEFISLSTVVYDIINIVIVILCIYPIIKFFKEDNTRIIKCNGE